MKTGKINRNDWLTITLILFLLIAAFLLSMGILLVNDMESSYDKDKLDGTEQVHICKSFKAPEKVTGPLRELYSTPYGTFEPIDSVLEINEYLTKNYTMLDFDMSIEYITESRDRERALEIMKEIEAISADICKGLRSDYEKAKAIAMWVGKNLIYDYDAMESEGSDLSVTSLEAILQNEYRTTCGGFSNMYSALCHSQGIFALNLIGGSSSQGYSRAQLAEAPANHRWNAVAVDGKWYYADCTWISDKGFKKGVISGGEDIKPFYAIFGFGEMSIEHRIDRSEHRCYFPY